MARSKITKKSRRTTFLLIAAIALVLILGAVVVFGWLLPSTGDVGSTPQTETPEVNRHLYPDAAEARQDISEALAKAGHEHKRVLVEFGGDWCGDCQVLDIYMHESPNAQLVAGHYVVVHVSIGQMDQNIDVAAQYGVPVAKGVPALAVLNPDGSVVYAQTNGEFDRMREMTPAAVTTFLKQWQG